MYSLISNLANPFCVFLAIHGVSLVAYCRAEPTSRILGKLSLATFLALYFSSTPLVAQWMIRLLDTGGARSDRVKQSDVIVVLGGSFRNLGDRNELSHSTLIRCLEGARLYHEGVSEDVIVAGGNKSGTVTIGSAMRDFLFAQGIPEHRVIIEEQSTSTWENATYSAAILSERHWNRICLVTDSAHQPRAARCFRKLGIEVEEAPVRSFVRHDLGWRDLIPSPQAVKLAAYASHEMVGLAWYRIRGRI